MGCIKFLAILTQNSQIINKTPVNTLLLTTNFQLE
jgi:hypothetical protein